MKYIAIRSSIGFRGRKWDKGDEFESQDGEVIPHHFVPKSEYKEVKPEARDIMAPRPMSFSGVVRAKGGFAAKIVNDLTKPMETKATAPKLTMAERMAKVRAGRKTK